MLSVLYLDIIGIKGSPTLKRGRKCQPSRGHCGWSEAHCGGELALGVRCLVLTCGGHFCLIL